jgi:hypothetical protein
MRHPHSFNSKVRNLTAILLAAVSLACWLLSSRQDVSPHSPLGEASLAEKPKALHVSGPAVGAAEFSMNNADGARRLLLREAYGKLPLSFEANVGQTDSQVKFLARGDGYGLFLTPTEAVLALSKGQRRVGKESPAVHWAEPRSVKTMRQAKSHGAAQVSGEVLRMGFVGANRAPKVEGNYELPSKSNYIIGSDPSKWRRDVSTFARVKYESVYPGVDVVYYGNQGQLEYDFVVAPHADHKRIRLQFKGATRVRIDGASGELILTTKDGSEVRQHRPIIYQEIAGERRQVEGSYELVRGSGVSFRVGNYDASRALVIDPVLVYSTYLGSDSDDHAQGIAVDAQGNAYVAGFTESAHFPIVPDSLLNPPFQPGYGGGLSDAFVTKFNADGGVVYSTYLGGSGSAEQDKGADAAVGIAVDAQGNVYVTGDTNSLDFPTKNPIQTTGDSFLTKLNAAGNGLIYSTYLNGGGVGVGVDSMGRAYVAGIVALSDVSSASVVKKLNAAGTEVLSSLQLNNILVDAFAIDSQGSAYVAGIDTDFDDGAGLAVTKITYNSLTNATAIAYEKDFVGHTTEDPLGHTNASADGIAVDAQGNAYVVGFTDAIDFPVQNAFQPTLGGGRDAVVMKLNATGGIVFSTYLGGSSGDEALGVAVDSLGNGYVAGITGSSNFPVHNAIQGANGGGVDFIKADAFVTKFNANGGIVYSTYLGGIDSDYGTAVAVDTKGNTYVVGFTQSTNFPTKNAFQGSYTGDGIESYDAFVTKIFEPATLQFSAATYSVGEGAGSVVVTVTREGNTSSAVSVDFATSDATASSRSDYNAALGTLSFAPGETSKTFTLFITDDVFVEGNETFNVTLGNAVGATLGSPAAAAVTITDNDTTPPTTNPIDDAAFFVRQQYRDFLNREPDAAGLAFWVNQMTNCGNPNPEVCRVNVSGAFFLSIEFQQTGYLVYKTYGAAFGTTRVGSTVPLTLAEFLPDVRRIGQNVVVGQGAWEAQLEANKVAYFDEFVSRSAFTAAYPSTLTAAQYVDALNANAGGALSTAERNQLVSDLTGGTKTRAQVLRSVAEDSDFTRAQFNRAFVLMQYYGYLRRNPNDAPDSNFNGYNFWLAKLNSFNGNYVAAEMVKAFLASDEYRHRFGQ